MPGFGEIFSQAIPYQHDNLLNRILLRGVMATLGRLVEDVRGADKLTQIPDPYIVVLNHSTRIEALVVPPLLAWYRQGKQIRFLADWNFLMVPGISLLYRRNGVIPVVRKPARPKVLNALRPWIVRQTTGFAGASQSLAKGESVGIFPEGTVNRDPHCLLTGQIGTAKLSLDTGTPVLPIGIRFPQPKRHDALEAFPTMRLVVGDPLDPCQFRSTQRRVSAVKQWHERIMSELGQLSGKRWEPTLSRMQEQACQTSTKSM